MAPAERNKPSCDLIYILMLVTSPIASQFINPPLFGLKNESTALFRVELIKRMAKKESVIGAEKPLLREVAYDRLKKSIQVGELLPGEPLYELHLSELLQISRTPVREALQQLVLEGLVKNMPNRAMMVATPSLEELLNVLHIRSLIDPEVVRLVAESVNKEVVDLLNQAVEDMQRAAKKDDRVAWAKADNIFHETLSTACPNQLLGRMGLQMRNRTQLVSTDAQTTSKRLCDCTNEHLEIVKAIELRDTIAAQKAMQDHIHHLRESFFKRLTHM
ncbi:MAG: GntR family transcriptional regulator [Rhodothermales bacterium]